MRTKIELNESTFYIEREKAFGKSKSIKEKKREEEEEEEDEGEKNKRQERDVAQCIGVIYNLSLKGESNNWADALNLN